MLLVAKVFAIAAVFKAQNKVDKMIIAVVWSFISLMFALMSNKTFLEITGKVFINFAVIYAALWFAERYEEFSLEWLGIFVVTTGVLLYI